MGNGDIARQDLEVITLDGPAGAGKSTVARELARRLGWIYVDSGAMYRAVALTARERSVDLDDSAALGRLTSALEIEIHPADATDETPRISIDGIDVTARLRDPAVTSAVGRVADSPEVRAVLRKIQRRLGQTGRTIMDGRDIGTQVFPAARYKFYLDADLNTRARRRLRNIRDAGHDASLGAVLADVERRDEEDHNRSIAPLKPAADAVSINTATFDSPEAVAEHILALIKSAAPSRAQGNDQSSGTP